MTNKVEGKKYIWWGQLKIPFSSDWNENTLEIIFFISKIP